MKSIFAVGFVAVALVACGDNLPRQVICGDGTCDPSETAACAEDCGCGNAVANPGEQCDGADLAGATCQTVVQRGGTLACNADCTFDTSGCDAAMCGNGVVEPGEECDGSDLAGADCGSLGFSAGDLACDASCGYVATGCCNDFCADAGASVCVGDSVEACVLQPNGCLAVEATDCEVDDDVCDDSGGSAVCLCVDRCPSAGAGRCAGAVAQTCAVQADGCLAWQATTDCATSGRGCAVGPQGPTCVVIASGENCADPYPIANGQNVIAWTAVGADYLTIQPSCNTSTLTGPDVVLSYTATVDGIATFSMAKPASARQVVVVSSDACGTLTNEVACASDSVPTAIGDTFAVATGTTYYFYVRDTTSGTAPLDSPLVVTVSEVACSSFTNNASNLSPANASTIATTSPVLSLDLEHPVSPAVGVITVTGDLGTSVAFDLAAAPPQVTFPNDGRTIAIDPAISFLPGETITVSWTGIVDAFCGAAIAPPAWTFDILTPSCTPGVAGMVGTTTALIATGVGTLTENYVAADGDPAGYVYFGGASDLFRIPKAGGAFEDVVVAAGITSTQLGSAMVIVGSRIFTLDTLTSTTNPFLWRLSTSGGVTWNPLGYGQWPMTVSDVPRAVFHHGGRLYIATDEITAGVPTQIWSVSATAVSLPDVATLEGTIPEEDCDGITGDDDYFYLTCANLDRVVRVDRTTFATELVTDAVDLSLIKNEIHAHDFDGDGLADALYFKSDEERVHYVCSPAGSAPFWTDILVTFGPGVAGASNFGLGFDPVAGMLWAYDDDTQELVSIQ